MGCSVGRCASIAEYPRRRVFVKHPVATKPKAASANVDGSGTVFTPTRNANRPVFATKLPLPMIEPISP